MVHMKCRYLKQYYYNISEQAVMDGWSLSVNFMITCHQIKLKQCTDCHCAYGNVYLHLAFV